MILQRHMACNLYIFSVRVKQLGFDNLEVAEHVFRVQPFHLLRNLILRGISTVATTNISFYFYLILFFQ